MGLTEYKKKRNFKVTAEPSGKPLPKLVKGACRFVIQKHDASRLHYDFRLEMDGVLKSWAVPKGLPWEKGEKHLAVEVEDHPVEYATFEGIIPQGQYGGGTVMVWDRGTWEPEADAREAMTKGRLTFTLHGEKLRGRWHLIRTKGDGKSENWLLFKGRDEAANDKLDIVAAKPESVISGRTVDEIAAAADRVWQSSRPQEPTVAEKRAAKIAAARPRASKPANSSSRPNSAWPTASLSPKPPSPSA